MKRTVLHLLDEAARLFPDSPYTNDKHDNGYVPASFKEMKEEARYIASGLSDLGLQKNDKISILAEGRTRWVASELAILTAGCISVPLSIKLLPGEILFRVNHSDSKLIVASRNTIEKLLTIRNEIKSENFKILYLDDDFKTLKETFSDKGFDFDKDVISYSGLLEKGKQTYRDNQEKLAKIKEETEEDDIVTICYTSGTTGNPKGIMLTHLNYYSNSRDAVTFFDVKLKDKLMIILPLDHSFAHTVGIYASLVRGLSIFFVDARGGGMATIKNIPINLKEANPNFMLTVPALSGNFMNKMKEGVAGKGKLIQNLFQSGLKAGIKLGGDGFRKPQGLSRLMPSIPYSVANALIFKKFRAVFGHDMKYCVGGGALLDISQQRFYYAIGVPIYQGYGLTEATPIISANTPKNHKMGTSGMVLPSVTCRIMKNDDTEAQTGEKGEIVIQGDNVMKGYYKNEQATKETIKDGWLYTGDLGYMDEDGFLVVVGREKALLISEDGEKYSPEEIEEAIVNTSQYVNQVMIHNDHNKYTSALVTLNVSSLENYIKSKDITTAEDLLSSIKDSLLSFKEHQDYRGKFPDKWIPSSFIILKEQFTEENHMINSTLKMVRYKIRETYQDKIDYMYTPEGNSAMNRKNIETLNEMFF